MFKIVTATSVIAIVLSGCMSPAVHLYNGAETTFRKGAPDYQKGATGEVTYCNAGLNTLVESRRQQALQTINETCKGNNYSITGESPGHSASCTLDNTIVFKCNAKKKK
ncbi:MAG: hypothetical protein AB7U44_07870 [Sulfuricurvum sp.]|uniref:hypothetical protein n=2 Tax=Sulfuricurvum sp. TaxID=2025608 RepID=UPI00262DF8B3|nr:hypothetical protein [Sulfuricurvum sp.]MDD2839425.1 hypothetical protein [Sulfuricurvum sp.]MDD3596641.1 hypothetical protein [Sulfuricurvum sp.]MDD4884390.1 hypothetical protein [Sulfuricurvum sp.]